MLNNKRLTPIKKLVDETCSILEKFQHKLDWKQIDQHQSLTFIDKNFRKKPSDVAKILLIFTAIVVFQIQGLRTLTILMCYLLPIGIMILKLCQALKPKRKKNNELKSKTKETLLEDKVTLQKNDSFLSVNSKQHEKKNQIPKLKEEAILEEGKTQNLNSLQIHKNQTEKNTSRQNQNKIVSLNQQQPTLNQLCQIFIFYLVVNLLLDLCEPLILLIFQLILSFMSITIFSIWQALLSQTYWALVLLPFKILGNILIQIFEFTQPNHAARFSFIFIRILVSAFLLNMKNQQKEFFMKLIFENKMTNFTLQSSIKEKPKAD